MKLANILEVQLDEIYEYDARYHIDCKDQAVGIGVNNGTNNFYTVPKALLDSQQKYIEMLEAEIKKLENKNT